VRQRRVDACGGCTVIEQQIPVVDHLRYAWRILRRLSRSCSARPQGGALVRGVRPAAKFVIMWLPGCLSWMIGVCESLRAAEPW
jgi:hypothetical protein